MNRRTWLKRMLGLAGAGTLAALSWPPLSFILHKIPKLPVKIRVRTQPEKDVMLMENDFFLFPDPDKPWAISRICTHLGCRVNYSSGEEVLVCPCHGSRFHTDGKLLKGPADKDLPSLPVACSRDEGYIVTLEDQV